jgi:ribosomal protein S18 acetylase RimI-like enzyme
MTHPDKGTEIFVYELGVLEHAQNRGIGRALVRALSGIAIARGCYGMWVLTDADNDPALRTYEHAGGKRSDGHVMFDWTFGADDALTPE